MALSKTSYDQFQPPVGPGATYSADGTSRLIPEGQLGKLVGLNLNAVAATTIFTTALPAGATRCIITKIVRSNESIAATTASVSFGSSGTPTDFSATAVNANAATTKYQVLSPTATLATAYGNAVAFVANVTIAQGAAATCDITVFGYYE